MDWKVYLQERINAIRVLAKDNTENNTLTERPILFRLMKFANAFLEGTGDSRIIVIYGLRGIGKSTILYQIYNRLVSGRFFSQLEPSKCVPQENILYLSIDQTLLLPFGKDVKSPIYDAVKNFCEQIHKQTLASLDKKLFILIDEAQFDKNWAVAAKSLFDESKNIFIIITGSSALALNLDTDTARRAIKEPLFPLSFMEYQVIKNKIFPIRGTAENLKRLVLQNDRTTVGELNASIVQITRNMAVRKLDLKKEIEEYITLGGFPFGFSLTKEITYRRLLDMIDRIVRQDIPIISNYQSDTIRDIIRIIGALALKPSGELPQTKLSTNLGISAAKVNDIIDTLEKSHLIFSVKPYPSAQPTEGLSKAFKYYFMSPTLVSAIRYLNGMTTVTLEETSVLWENSVGSTLFKLCYTTGTIYNLFYDPRKETNVDYLLQNPLSGEIIPVEVGLNKGDKQLKDAIEFYSASYGIIVSDFPEITFEEKIIRIPFWVFLYI
ncbi:MAG TPA: AAA family ATPase [archaeon]|nr:AAA family ATPase [archaeon]